MEQIESRVVAVIGLVLGLLGLDAASCCDTPRVDLWRLRTCVSTLEESRCRTYREELVLLIGFVV